MGTFLVSLLEHYQITLDDLRSRKLPGSFHNLKTPFGDERFEKVVSRLEKAIRDQEKTVIYGDYDVDGLTSTAILKRALSERGLNPGYFIPSRYREGYGICKSRVEDFKEKGYSLIVTVDNGITCSEAIQKAKELGMEVIIIDHHELSQELPDTKYIFHQKLTPFIDYNCSAASLCFFVASKLLKRFDCYLATLSGIAVFSDVMPMTGNNLELAKIALSSLKKHLYPNLISLIGPNHSEITYDDFNFKIIPSLNSVGRIEKDVMATNHACALLMDKDNLPSVLKLSDFVLRTNDERKKIVKAMRVEEKEKFESTHSFCSMVKGPSGLCGLFANRLLREKNKGILIFAEDEKDTNMFTGSIRVPSGYDMVSFLNKNRKYFVTCGGHPQACGVTIRKQDYFQVALLFSTEIEKQALLLPKEKDESIEISFEDLNQENFDILNDFLPFGEGFPSPQFKITVSKTSLVIADSKKATFVFDRAHSRKITFFGVPESIHGNAAGEITFVGEFKKEVFNGKTSYVLLASKSFSS